MLFKEICEIKYFDPSINKKDSLIREKFHRIGLYPVFSIVEFNLLMACTRACSFCPVSKGFYNSASTKGVMSRNLFSKIIEELKDLSYSGILLFSGFSEPLLHKEIVDFVSLARKALPSAHVEIITNGDLLTAEKIRTIFQAGLNRMVVSVYDGLEAMRKFESLRLDLGLDSQKMVLRRRYFDGNNYGLTLSNRGGLIKSEDFEEENKKNDVPLAVPLPLDRPCFYPFYMLKVDFNGDVLLCSHDWQKKKIIGNVANITLWEAWTNSEVNEVRKNLIRSKRNHEPCCRCDVIGNLMGEEFFLEWSKIYAGEK